MFRPSASRNFDAALRDLEATKPKVRAAAAPELARFVDVDRPRVVKALMGALDDEHADVRAAAALALADAKADKAVAALIEVTDDAHDRVRQMALAALGELRDERALSCVEQGLSDANPATRFQAVMALPRVCRSHERSVAALLTASADDDPLVRHIALRMAEELGSDGDEPVDPALVERAVELLDDDSEVVQVAAAIILGRCGRRDGEDILCALARRDISTSESEDEATAIELCGELGLEEAIPALEKRGFGRVFLAQRDHCTWQARVALAAMGHERGVQWVLTELGAWTQQRRTMAVAAASRAKVRAATERIRKMRGDPAIADEDAVEQALEVLQGLGKEADR